MARVAHAPAPEGTPEHPSRPAWIRLVVGVAAGIIASAIAPGRFGVSIKLIAGWNAAALAIAALAWWLIARTGPTRTRILAASTDPGRLAIGGLLILASAFSMFATGFALHGAKSCPVDSRPLFLGLGLLAGWGLRGRSGAVAGVSVGAPSPASCAGVGPGLHGLSI